MLSIYKWLVGREYIMNRKIILFAMISVVFFVGCSKQEPPSSSDETGETYNESQDILEQTDNQSQDIVEPTNNQPLNIVEPINLSRIEILREYAEYGNDKYDVTFEYKFDERENMLDIIEEYKLDELVEGKSDVDTAITLMNWLCERYKHGNPPNGLEDNRTPQELMEHADNNGGATNCRGLSLILAQLIRAYNIKAFHITCMPYEEPFNDCHVVVSVYCESLSKWIMLDPSYNLYLSNENGELIGVEELRDILIEGGELNAPKRDIIYWYSEYMTKNLVRLQRATVECYGSDGNTPTIMLTPEKYMQNEVKNNFEEKYHKYFMTSREDFWKE